MAAAATTLVCRLCMSKASKNHYCLLFSAGAVQKKLSCRLGGLLEMDFDAQDGLPSLICEKCKRRFETLEKSVHDLTEFQKMARNSFDAFNTRGNLKRKKECSVQTGVSPDIARSRPPLKRMNIRRLQYDKENSGNDVRTQSVSAATVIESSNSEVITPPRRDRIDENAVPLPQHVEPHTPGLKKEVTVTVKTPSRSTPWTTVLPQDETKIGRALAGGHLPSIAKSILSHEKLRELLFKHFLTQIETECSRLCQRHPNSSVFRKISQPLLADFDWKVFIEDLQTKAPTFFQILSTITSHGDRRNKTKVGNAHNPGICMAAAVILKERNREMSGVQSLISFLLFASHVNKQVYTRLNHLNVSLSYNATLTLIQNISKDHTLPLQKWIEDGVIFKFWSDNVDKKKKVRDIRSDHQGDMLHMYSILAGKSRTPDKSLAHTGVVASLKSQCSSSFLPTREDVLIVKKNLVTLVSRILTHYIQGISCLSKAVPQHITHRYSKEMSLKSEVIVLDILMKNENCHSDMVDIMTTMQEYLGNEYPSDRRVASGGDHLTCERQLGAQRHMMDGDTPKDRLELLEPQAEDWHCLVCVLGVIWKRLYNQSSARDHGTLGFFRSKLNRITVTKDVKKDVNAALDFLLTVVKGHLLAAACEIIGITKLDSHIPLPAHVQYGQASEKNAYVRSIASQVVERCTLIDDAFTDENVLNTKDAKYNYARVLCHYGGLVMEFLDSWAEGDGERVFRCWRLFLPHFHASGRTKYSLQALRVQFQIKCMLSPQLAHEVMWHRFVNTRGGLGRNIPCDLYNEHINKLLKEIIVNMGSNITKEALQRSARSVSTLQAVCSQFDQVSGVPAGTSAHATYSDKKDIEKVIGVVIQNDLLTESHSKREHATYARIHFNPLNDWNKTKTKKWIEQKKLDFMKFNGSLNASDSDSDTDIEVDQN